MGVYLQIYARSIYIWCLQANNCLVRDLELYHSDKFRNYIRIEPGTFEELLSKVEPLISKNLKYFKRKTAKVSSLFPKPVIKIIAKTT
jgi:hypothetical protein